MNKEQSRFRLTSVLSGALLLLAVCLLPAPVQGAHPQVIFTQLTVTAPDACAGFGSYYPTLDATGKKVAFTSYCDFVPGGNTDGNSDLYFMNTDGTGLRQLTFTTGCLGISEPSLDSAGLRVVFASDCDLVAGGNTDGNFDLFMINVDGTGLVQLTNTTGGNFTLGFPGCVEPHFDPKGLKIAFSSDRDLVAGGNLDGNQEIFVMNTDGTGIRQLTNTTGGFGNTMPNLDATATRVLFSSDRDLVAGSNSDLNYEIFMMNVNGTGIVQLTNTTSGGGSFFPRWTPMPRRSLSDQTATWSETIPTEAMRSSG